MILSKLDLLAPDAEPPKVDAPDAWGTFVVSSVTRKGLPELLEALWNQVREAVRDAWDQEPQPETYRP